MELSQCQGNNNLLVSTSYRAHVDFRKSELKAWQGSSKSWSPTSPVFLLFLQNPNVVLSSPEQNASGDGDLTTTLRDETISERSLRLSWDNSLPVALRSGSGSHNWEVKRRMKLLPEVFFSGLITSCSHHCPREKGSGLLGFLAPSAHQSLRKTRNSSFLSRAPLPPLWEFEASLETTASGVPSGNSLLLLLVHAGMQTRMEDREVHTLGLLRTSDFSSGTPVLDPRTF